MLEGLDLGVVESLFLAQPLLEATLQRLLLHLFSLPPRSPLAPILPTLDPPSSTSLSTLQQIFLASNLPHHLRALWRPVFSTDLHGESFSKFAGNIINQGPTLIIVWDEVCAHPLFLKIFQNPPFSGRKCFWWFCNGELEAWTQVLWKARELPVPAGSDHGGLRHHPLQLKLPVLQLEAENDAQRSGDGRPARILWPVDRLRIWAGM